MPSGSLDLGIVKIRYGVFLASPSAIIIIVAYVHVVCSCGHVLHAARVHEPLQWVGRESSHEAEELLTYVHTNPRRTLHVGDDFKCCRRLLIFIA